MAFQPIYKVLPNENRLFLINGISILDNCHCYHGQDFWELKFYTQMRVNQEKLDSGN